jgi:hypothetical protein
MPAGASSRSSARTCGPGPPDLVTGLARKTPGHTRVTGAAQSMGQLIAFRALQGLGAGALSARALTGVTAPAGAAHLNAVATGTCHIFIAAAALCAAGIIAALLINEVPLRDDPATSRTRTAKPSLTTPAGNPSPGPTQRRPNRCRSGRLQPPSDPLTGTTRHLPGAPCHRLPTASANRSLRHPQTSAVT